MVKRSGTTCDLVIEPHIDVLLRARYIPLSVFGKSGQQRMNTGAITIDHTITTHSIQI